MSECINNAFRTKLYNWRMANNFSLAEAATSLRVPYSSYCHWEAGDNQPRTSTLAKILPIIDTTPAPVEKPEPVEELWVPEPVEPKRPLTFRERMEQRHGGPEEYFKKTIDMAEKEACDGVPTEFIEAPVPTEAPQSLFDLALQKFDAKAIGEARASAETKARAEAYGITKPTPSLVKLTEVIGFLKCLALYAAEGVAEPLEQQIKTLQDIAEEMSA